MTLSQALGGTGCILLFVIIVAGGFGAGMLGEGHRRTGVFLVAFAVLASIASLGLFIAAIWVDLE